MFGKELKYLFPVTLLLIAVLFSTCSNSPEKKLKLVSRYEMTHPGMGHELHMSPPSVAVTQDGGVLVAWVVQEEKTNNLYVAHPNTNGSQPLRVNPEGMGVDSVHQSPGIAVGPKGEIYVSWSSQKSKPEGVIFASDLRLSRSLDGGKSFDSHIRVNEDRPISHSFEGLDVGSDGTVFISWIDSREGWEKAGTYLASIAENGTRVKGIVKLDGNTCVCCRVDVATGPDDKVAVLWRKEFPDNVRDMVLVLKSNGSFSSPNLVHSDGWKMDACPHRGGDVAIDGQGRIYVSWYTEGDQYKPNLLFASSSGDNDFRSPQRLDESTASIPDHVRMAVNKAGDTVIVWEDSTAVRRRILLRYSTNGGKTFSPVHVLSQAIKAYAPDIAVNPKGGFVLVWHEEQFPSVKTVVQQIRLEDTDR